MTKNQYLLTLTEQERDLLKGLLENSPKTTLPHIREIRDSALNKLNTTANCKIFGLEDFVEDFEDDPEPRLCVLGVLTNDDIDSSPIISSDNVTDKEFFYVGDMMQNSLEETGLTFQEALYEALHEVTGRNND